MSEQHPSKWRHFEAEIILVCARWYLRYALSYRDMEERGLSVDLTTIYRWVQYAAFIAELFGVAIETSFFNDEAPFFGILFVFLQCSPNISLFMTVFLSCQQNGTLRIQAVQLRQTTIHYHQ